MENILYIITGATGGLGLSLFKQLNKPSKDYQNHLVLIGRNKEKLNEMLSGQELKFNNVHIYSSDLAECNAGEISNFFKKLKWLDYSKVILINNASTILPIKHLHNLNDNEVRYSIELNLVAPILLTQQFMSYCNMYKKNNAFVINISSGVSKIPIEGWGLYCISKSALNMLSGMVSVDSARWEYPVKSLSINPGPLNTSMQENIRKSNRSQSPIKEKFEKMYANDELSDPNLIAKKIIKIINQNNFPNAEFIDFNEKNKSG